MHIIQNPVIPTKQKIKNSNLKSRHSRAGGRRHSRAGGNRHSRAGGNFVIPAQAGIYLCRCGNLSGKIQC
ncbi:hypothetical protein EZZ76_10185 [Neisseria meningitidis]|nr:hypothetical protein [Neisseria meningitidis]